MQARAADRNPPTHPGVTVVTFALLASSLVLAYLGFAALNVEVALAKRDGRPVAGSMLGSIAGLFVLGMFDALASLWVNLR